MLGFLAVFVTAGFVGLSALALFLAKLQRRDLHGLAVGLGLAFVGWGALYGSVLVGTSLAAEPRVLAMDEDKAYCGFYLDCHLHSAVVRVDTMDGVGSGATAVQATRMFIAVTVRVSSSAARVPMQFTRPRAVLRDSRGREYHRALAAERAWMASGAPNRPLTEAVAPGESFETTLLFDVPRESEGLVLDLADGQLLNRVAEFFLIGDDDSFLFPRPVFSLRP